MATKVNKESNLKSPSRFFGSSKQDAKSSSPSQGLSSVSLVKFIQLVVMVFALCIGYSFATQYFQSLQSREDSLPVVRQVSANEVLPVLPKYSLLNINDFEFILNNPDICKHKPLFFVILIHSKPDHFRQRQAIRQTWGSITKLDETWSFASVFLLGLPTLDTLSGINVEKLLKRENGKHNDIIVGKFYDTYHNLTYKHVMGLKWTSEYCRHAKYVIKADDDAFIDVLALHGYLQRTFDDFSEKRKFIACNVIPEGTKPLRNGKWAVSLHDYPWNYYPRYCGGLAYITTPELVDNLYKLAHMDVGPYLWVDDVWITGIVASAIETNYVYLNARYSYDQDEITTWLTRAKKASRPPYNFVHLDPLRPDWRNTLDNLWIHSVLAQNASI